MSTLVRGAETGSAHVGQNATERAGKGCCAEEEGNTEVLLSPCVPAIVNLHHPESM